VTGFALDLELTRFGQLKHEWAGLTAPSPQTIREWTSRLEILQQSETALREAGRWVRGPSDLLGILRLGTDELRHCMVLSWLLDPVGAHGLGYSVLRRLLQVCANDYELTPGQVVSTRTEEVRGQGTPDETRADIVVDCGDLSVVIEAKVYAGEQHRQAERLVRLWSDDRIDCRFVFLTMNQRMPTTAGPYKERWMPLSWTTVASWLSEEIELVPHDAQGRTAMEEWLSTARRVLR
jgi:hypothetical protein